MSVSVMVMVIVCLCVCVFVIVCVCVFVIVRQSVSNVDNYLIYTCAETHRIKERDQLYFWKWGNIKSMARKKTPALSNLFLEKAQTWSPLQKNHCIKDRGQFSLTSEKRKTLGWFEHQSKHLKGRSGPRVGDVFGSNICKVIRDPVLKLKKQFLKKIEKKLWKKISFFSDHSI